jgi:hypothetical protein
MRAREFITEQRGHLDPSQIAAMPNTYVIPGLTSQDPYKTYRFGMALARARGIETVEDLPEFTEEGAFGELAVIAGSENVDELIDRALKLAGIPGGKKLVGSTHSHEVDTTNTQSPVKGFKGYPR